MNESAIIKQSSGKAVEVKGFDGLFTCLMEHKVAETSAKFNWTGPKISAAMWSEVMAFFEWTQSTERSEAQVRLFVHPVHGWRAWAFPQVGGTGMTSREEGMDTPESALQRQRFSEHEGWIYWGTVHHHCTASAFQSGTDEANESSQEGLHITIGHMDKPNRDIHCRMYLKQHRFEPMMENFWQIDPVIMSKIDEFERMFGMKPSLDSVARKQMAQSALLLRTMLADDQLPTPEFPEIWKTNYKVRNWQPGNNVTSSYYGGGAGRYPFHGGGGTNGSERWRDWCVHCASWESHSSAECPKIKGLATGPQGIEVPRTLSKKELKALKKKKRLEELQATTPPLMEKTDINKEKIPYEKALGLFEALKNQCQIIGVAPADFRETIFDMAQSFDTQAREMIFEELRKNGMTLTHMYAVAIQQEKEEEEREALKEAEEEKKEQDAAAKEVSEAQRQRLQVQEEIDRWYGD